MLTIFCLIFVCMFRSIRFMPFKLFYAIRRNETCCFVFFKWSWHFLSKYHSRSLNFKKDMNYHPVSLQNYEVLQHSQNTDPSGSLTRWAVQSGVNYVAVQGLQYLTIPNQPHARGVHVPQETNCARFGTAQSRTDSTNPASLLYARRVSPLRCKKNLGRGMGFND